MEQLFLVMAFAISGGAVLGYVAGWLIAAQWGNTGLAREQVGHGHDAVMTRGYVAAAFSMRTATSFGFLTFVFYGAYLLVAG